MSTAFTRGLKRLFGIRPKNKENPQVVKVVPMPKNNEIAKPFSVETISAKEGEVKKTTKKKTSSKKKPKTKKKSVSKK